LLCGRWHAAAAEAPAAGEPKPVVKSAVLFDDPVVVRGKGFEVKRSQLDEAFMAYAANLAARGQSLAEEHRPLREAQLLDRLVITRLLVIRATDQDTNRATELSKKFTADARRAATSEEMFRRQLKAAGMSQEGFANRVMEQALAEAVIERELRPKVNITDAQVDEFYRTGADLLVKDMEAGIDQMGKNPNTTIGDLAEARKRVEDVKKVNLAKLEQPEKVRVSHILIATRDHDTEEELTPDKKKQKRQLAEKILARARAGEDFGKLAKEFSDDKGSPESQGNYIFSRDDPFVPEFKSAAFSLATNQISDIVATTFGYHIIKLHERVPAKKLELAKVAHEIKEALAQQGLQSKMPEFFTEVKKAAAVEILDPKYKLNLPKATDSLRPPS
jgi:parvulin-like peptidyl-prolyl isomerase